ncbi:MAG: outer membrane protein assembly factor BamD [Gammaproteobacteria bacterium]|nr:outer membrane protein assembly factor BamD [Gammaproteobacteria bacterium]
MFLSFKEQSQHRTGLRFRFQNRIISLFCIFLLSGCAMFGNDDADEDGPVPPAEELYAEAQVQMSENEWEDAIETLRRIEAEYPYGEYAMQAMVDTIYAYYRFGDIAMVKASADRFIKLHPTNESVAYAYYLKGLVSFKEDKSLLGVLMGIDDISYRDATNMLEALQAFRNSYEQFPDSEYAPASRKQAKEMEDALAKYEINIAKFYYKREAYVAAVNRAERVIENYSTSPAVEDALGVLLQSYNRMEMEDLADDSRRVLQLNFPDSEYLKGSGAIE